MKTDSPISRASAEILRRLLPAAPYPVRDFLSKTPFEKILRQASDSGQTFLSLPFYDPELTPWAESEGETLLCPFFFAALDSFCREKGLEISPSVQAEGFVFYALGILLALRREQTPAERSVYERSLYLYSLLYMIVDNYLDSPGPENSSLRLQQVMLALAIQKGQKGQQSLPTALLAAQQVYGQLVALSPECEPCLLQAFRAEVTGVAVQGRGDLCPADYWEKMLDKGRTTALVIWALAGRPGEEGPWAKAGEIIQLLDDALDVEEDARAGIHTAATIHLAQAGNLDSFILLCLEEIRQLGPALAHMRPLFAVAATYIASESSHTSLELRQTLRPWTLFDHHLGFRALGDLERVVEKREERKRKQQ